MYFTQTERTSVAKSYFKGANFMTPTVIAYYEDNKDNFCELSTGIGFDGRKIFGCTFSGNHEIDYHKYNNSFSDKEKAIKYIKNTNINIIED